MCRDTARDTAVIRRPVPCDTAQERCDTGDSARGRGLGRNTILYRDRGGATTRPACARDTALRHGTQHSQGAVCVPHAQPGPWVCALCTGPSFDSVHCFESLFMDTVHGVFKKIKIK